MQRKKLKRIISYLGICVLVSLMVLSSVIVQYHKKTDEENVIDHTEEEKTAQPLRYKDEEIKDPINLTTGFDKSFVEDDDPYTDENGNLTVPFDVAYPEIFDSGEVQYDERSLLIKVKNGKDISKELKKLGVEKIEEMFEVSSGTWYEGFIKENEDIRAIMGNIRSAEDVLEAEYNFVWESADSIVDEQISDKIEGLSDNDKILEQWYLRSCGIQEAWEYQQENDLPLAGEGMTVAVIDTGVDYTHEDLYSNMWVNRNEVPDNGIDDDGNGYIDDYYGVDLINGTGSGKDDHGHGTHVAGIIAGANNKTGIVGVAYNSKIMAVKAGSASGLFSQSDIAKAIIYAHNNGADVINMSFGGTASTIAVQDALEFAYTNCVLVASAGNDKKVNENIGRGAWLPIYPAAFTYVLGVMAVDENGRETEFTNFDGIEGTKAEYEVYAPGESILSSIPDNRYAVWSGTSMAAPIVSAMAAMTRSVFADRSMYPTKYIYGQLSSTGDRKAICYDEELHGDFHNRPYIADMYGALTKSPTPDIHLLDYRIFDNVGLNEKNNGDGTIDSGEIIELGFEVWNRWGMVKDVTVNIDSYSEAGLANPYVQFSDSLNGNYGDAASLNYGQIGTYSSTDAGKIYEDDVWTGWRAPFYLKIKDNCPNDMIFFVNITITGKNALDEEDQTVYDAGKINPIALTVRNGVVLPMIIEEDMTLTADNYYILSNAVYVKSGVTVNVEPGTKIQFWSNDPNDAYAETSIVYLRSDGVVNFNGTKEEHISIFPSELMDSYRVEMYGNMHFKYCDITNPYIVNIGNGNYDDAFENCRFDQNYKGALLYRSFWDNEIWIWQCAPTIQTDAVLKNCCFYKMGGAQMADLSGKFDTCSFIDTNIQARASDSGSSFVNCLFYGNNVNTYEGNDAPADIIVGKGTRRPAIMGKIVKNEESGDTYAVVRLPLVTYDNTRYDFEILDALLETFGGRVVSFETDGEYEFVKKNFLDNNADLMTYRYIDVDENGVARDVNGKNISLQTYLSKGRYLTCTRSTKTIVNDPLYIVEDFSNYRSEIQSINGEGSYYLCNVIAEIPGEIYVSDIGLREGSADIDLDSVYQISASPYPNNGKKLIYETKEDDFNVAFHSEEYGRWMVTDGNNEYLLGVVHNNDEEGTLYLSYDDGFVMSGEGTGSGFRFYKESNGKYEDVKELKDGDRIIIYDVTHGACVGNTYEGNKGAAVLIDLSGDTLVSDRTDIVWTVRVNDDSTYSFLQDDKILSAVKVVDVDENGLITPQNIGTSKVYVYSDDKGVYSIFDVSVRDAIALTGISLDVSKDRLNVGDAFKANVTLVPEDTTQRSYHFESSNENVLTVSPSGKISAISPGSARISVISDKDASICAYADITVISRASDLHFVESIYSTSLTADDGHAFYPSISPADCTEKLYWLSSNPEVAYVDENGDLIKLKNGTARLKVTTEMTGLSNEILINITDYQSSSKIVKLKGLNYMGKNYVLALFDNGELWAWGGGVIKSPQKLRTDYFIKDFTVQGSLYIVDDNGVLYRSNDDLLTALDMEVPSFEHFFDDVERVESFISSTIGDPMCLIRTDGTVWFWAGDNTYGIYGNGSYTASQTPVQADIDGVKDVRLSSRFFALFLKENGDVYFTGGVEKKRNEPVKIAEGIEAFESDLTPYSLLYASSADKIYRFSGDNVEDMDMPVRGSYRWFADPGAQYYCVEDGRLYVRTGGYVDSGAIGLGDIKDTNGEFVRVDGLENVDRVFSDGSTTYIQLSDGTIYGCGLNNYGELADFGNETSFTPKKVYFGLQKNSDTLTLESDNMKQGVVSKISSDTISYIEDEYLILDFNDAIYKGANYTNMVMTDSNGRQISLDRQIVLDKFYIRKVGGFEESVTYTLSIPYNSISTLFTASNKEDIVYKDFYYVPKTQAAEDPVIEEPVEETEVIEEETIETFVNEDVKRFYWTADMISEKTDWYDRHVPYEAFENNAIINRLNVDDPQYSWLRLRGSETDSYKEQSISNNYWGTKNELLIGKQILDFEDYSVLMNLNHDPIMEIPSENIWPFVTEAGVLNADREKVSVVGNETVIFYVEFNRSMDTSVDLDFRFGSTYPYGDYQVLGEWVSDRRWEGTATIATVIESGTQYMAISNGFSDDEDHLEFMRDWGRFEFEIDMSAALSMTMQGEATDRGISLSWMQDDFDTLIGYNVYRSEMEDGYYQKLNATVLPADVKEFFDDTVEPGKTYYYNFTVVQSDLSESTPSGKIRIRSKDTMAPDIYHTPVYTAYAGSNIVISATIIDNIEVQRATLHYRITGSEKWVDVNMTKNNDKYYAIIPGVDVTMDGIEYYIDAYDGSSYNYSQTASCPHTIVVKEPIGDDSLGDVDGDGKITNKDALMIIQAVNDLLNLNDEQFSRADINKDGELSSAEALVILKYVSGKITRIAL